MMGWRAVMVCYAATENSALLIYFCGPIVYVLSSFQ